MKHLFVACLAFGMAASPLTSAARTWKSKDGRFSIEAELTGVEDGKAQLKKADGKVLAVPVDSLDQGDREYAEGFRTWKSGKFSIFAEYVDCNDGKVQLRKADGSKLHVDLQKLGPEDRHWVKERQGEAEPEPSPGASKSADGKALEGLGAHNVAMKLVRLDSPKSLGGKNSTKSAKPAQYCLALTTPQLFIMQVRDGQPVNQQTAFQNVVSKEPEYVAPVPFKSMARFDGRQYAFVLDVTDAKAKGYNKLYFDLNRNGDLTDDKPVTTKEVNADAKKGASQSLFPRVDLPLEGKKGAEEYSFLLNVSCSASGNQQTAVIMLYAAAMREGYLTQGGQKVHLILLDRNSNGRFDDLLSVAHRGDRPSLNPGDLLLINPNPKNILSNGAQGKDQYYLNRTLSLGKKFFHLDISPTGDNIKLSPVDLALGSVKNSSPSYCAWLTSDEYGVMMIQGTKGQKMPLPAGDWKMVSYSLSASPNGGPSSSMLEASFPDSCEGITVKKGNTQELPFGAPYKSRVAAHRQDDKVYLLLDIVGAGGEKCTSLAVNGKGPPGPLFVVKDADGKEVHKGKFEFG